MSVSKWKGILQFAAVAKTFSPIDPHPPHIKMVHPLTYVNNVIRDLSVTVRLRVFNDENTIVVEI